jgi:hypothetical protein
VGSDAAQGGTGFHDRGQVRLQFIEEGVAVARVKAPSHDGMA